MKFVHIADLHLDSPFTLLSESVNLGEQRRIEQCMSLKKVIEFIKENEVEYLFISGDLYENDYIKKSTLDYINSLFYEIPNTKIFISPGNHDPYIIDSPYDIFPFAPNVYIFKSDELEIIEDGDINIYGTAFTDFYRYNNPIDSIGELDYTKTNIIVLHCDLNGAKNKNEIAYLPISESKLKSLKFDYCALGHIHKKYISNDNSIVYPGSLTSLGFDELDEHGMIVGEILNGCVKTEFIKVDNREFVEEKIEVSSCNSTMEIIQRINEIHYNDMNFYKIILVGQRDFDINIRTIKSAINLNNVLSIIDLTQRSYDIQSIANERSLRGAFVRKVIQLSENNRITQEDMDKIIEIGLESMK